MKIVKIEYMFEENPVDLSLAARQRYIASILSLLMEQLLQDSAFRILSSREVRDVLIEKIASYNRPDRKT